jgi:hypothetical protein
MRTDLTLTFTNLNPSAFVVSRTCKRQKAIRKGRQVAVGEKQLSNLCATCFYFKQLATCNYMIHTSSDRIRYYNGNYFFLINQLS